jgi:hypothetical protein
MKNAFLATKVFSTRAHEEFSMTSTAESFVQKRVLPGYETI